MSSAGRFETDDWRPSASLSNLRARSEWIRWLRCYFWERGYWEVETPLLSRETVVDRHLEPPLVSAASLGLGPQLAGDWYLQTSPEFGMKRLLAAGAERIFQLGRAFRGGEQGSLHNPEFTMLEWYDVAADYEQGINFLRQLATAFFETAGCGRETYAAVWCRGLGKRLGLSPEQAWSIFAGQPSALGEVVGPLAGLSRGQLADWDRDSLLNLVWTECVEPLLGWDEPVVIVDWPASQAALARTRHTAEGEVAERFELYFRGVELANGYHELADAKILAERFRLNNDLRVRDGRLRLPEQSRLEQAMRLGPRLGSGVAAGVDRWIMLRLGVSSLAEVIAFPVDRA